MHPPDSLSGGEVAGGCLPFELSLYISRKCRLHTEKAVAPHSSTLAWKIPWTEEPGRLQSMGLQRVGLD